MRTNLRGPLVAFMLAIGAAPAWAEPTTVVIRVLSKDAKFIGTSMGGVRITLRDAETREILATGITQGGTGDTKRMMQSQGGRRELLSDASSAKFETVLDLDTPRIVEVEAYGPLGQRQAAQRVTASQWIVPGRGTGNGDGWVLEMPGFAVDVLAPPAHARLSAAPSVEIRANVVMMCGCPIEPKGLWDAEKYEVQAIVTRDGKPLTRLPLSYAGSTSQFVATLPTDGPGLYDVIVYAHDPVNGNTGIDRTAFFIDKK